MDNGIKFEGFSGKWKYRPFREVFNEYSEKNSPELPVLTIVQGQGTVRRDESGRTIHFDESALKNYKVVNKEDFILHLRSFEAGFEKANETGLVSPAYHMFHGENVDTRFYYPFFRSSYFINVLLKPCVYGIRDGRSIDIGEMQKILIPVPPYEEQKKIGDLLEAFDVKIASEKIEVEKLKALKASLLTKMFPKEGETVPEIRFAGFMDEWKQVRLESVFTKRHEVSVITDEYPQLSFTIADGVIWPEDKKTNKRDFLIKDKDNKKYLITEKDDILYNPANVIFGAIHMNKLSRGVVSPIYKIFSTDQDPAFMECIVRAKKFIAEMALHAEGSVTKLKTLKPEAFLDMNVFIAPTLLEQRQIGSFFGTLEKEITLHQRKYEKLLDARKALLVKLIGGEE